MNNKIYYQRKERWLKRELYIKKQRLMMLELEVENLRLKLLLEKEKTKIFFHSDIKNERADQLSHPLHLVFNKHLWGTDAHKLFYCPLLVLPHVILQSHYFNRNEETTIRKIYTRYIIYKKNVSAFIHQLKRYFPKWWSRSESNQRHKDFQSFALPTELRDHLVAGEGFEPTTSGL